MNLVDVKSVLDIGAGVGLLGVLLNYWYGIEVEATDVEDEKGASGYKNMYKKIFKHMKTPRHICEIKNGKPIKLPKKYDMITMTRTVFDREELEGGYDNKYPHEKFDYEYFLNDIFQYCNRIFWKTNWQAIANKKVFPKSIHPFLWWPTKNRGSSDYKEDWLGRVDANDIRNPNPYPINIFCRLKEAISLALIPNSEKYTISIPNSTPLKSFFSISVCCNRKD